MDWQEIIALGIVAATAALLVRNLLKRREPGAKGCGHCPGSGNPARQPSFVLKGRKNGPVHLQLKS